MPGSSSPESSASTAGSVAGSVESLARLPCLVEPEWDAAVLAGLDRMYRMDYAAADSIFASALPGGSPGRAYFRGLALFNRFNDLGDTAALGRADSLWSEVTRMQFRNSGSRQSGDSLRLDLYRGLSTLQLSYVASLTGRKVRAARLGGKAAGQLRPLGGKAEADAALALYDYYKASLLKDVDWLPFVKADAAGPLRRLEESLPRSRYLREVLQTSLLWLYYDSGRYQDGLDLVDAFLARYPGNRTYRQARADFLFRKGMVEDDVGVRAAGEVGAARDIHEALKREYADRMASCPPPQCIPLGYLSSVGNLVKIYGNLGRPELRRKHVDIWSSSKFRPYLSWLPGSLKREVDAQSK